MLLASALVRKIASLLLLLSPFLPFTLTSSAAPSPGAIRSDFTNSMNGTAVMEIAPSSDGEFFIGGDFTTNQGSFFTGDAARIRLNGSVNTNFSANGSGNASAVRGIVELANGRLLVGGDFSSWIGVTNIGLVRLTSAGAADTTFVSGVNSSVKRMLRLPDGGVLVGVGNPTFNSGTVYRYTSNGVLDSTFVSFPPISGQLFDLAMQSSGKLIAVGTFGMRILNADGTGSTGFGPGGVSVLTVHAAPDDKIYYSDTNGTTFARLATDGSPDSSFNVTINGRVHAMAFLPNNRLLIGGSFTVVNGASRPYLAVLESNGTLATDFASPYSVVAGGAVHAIELLEDGSALIGGTLVISVPSSQARIQRVQIHSPGAYFVTHPVSQTVNRGTAVTFTAAAEGTSTIGYQWRKNGGPIPGATNSTYFLPSALDSHSGNYDVVITNLSGSKTSRVAVLTVLGDVLITQPPANLTVFQGSVASFSVTATGAVPFTYQWRRNGTNISGANASTYSFVALTNDAAIYSVEVANFLGAALSPDASLSVAGDTGPAPMPGTLNTNIVPGTLGATSPYVYGLAVDAGGRILATGNFTTYNGQTRNRFLRLNADLSLDALAPSFDNATFPILPLNNGGFAVGGNFLTVNSATSYGLAFFDAAGVRQAQPVLSNNGYIDGGGSPGGLFRQPDGKVLIGGNFYNTVNGVSRVRLARLNADGSLDTTFAPTVNPNNNVTAVGLDAAGNVLISGIFTSPRVGLARYTTNGTLDTAFTTALGSSSSGFGFALQSSGKVIVHGSFATVDGQSRAGLARLNLDGSLDTTFNANLGGSQTHVYDAVLEPDDKMVICGAFTSVNGITRKCLARLTAEGALDTTFGTITGGATGGGTPAIYSIAKVPDGGLVAGGTFTSFDGVGRNYLAKLFYTPLPLPPRGIVQQPQPVSTLPGGVVSFSVSAVGTAPLTFQWRKGTTPINNATNATYTLIGVQAGDVDNYNVVVTDANGSTPSQDASLSLITGLTYSSWLSGKGLTAGVNDGPSQDPDGDGVNNLLEYVFGTHPNNSASGARPTAVTVLVGGQSYRAVRFIRQKNITDVTMTVTTGSNVKFTSALATTLMPLVDLGGGLEEVTVRAVDPTANTPVIFFHTQVNQNPE